MNGWMNMWWMGSGMWFWVLIIVGIAYFFYMGGLPRTRREEMTPLEVAKMRYAKGEITQEEYEKIKQAL